MGKRYQEAQKLVDRTKKYALEEAIPLVKQQPKAKFNEAVELSGSLNMDSKKSDQVIRGTVILPHGTGKVRRVLAFCKGEKELQAKEAGADYVGSDEFVEKVKGGWLDFDVIIASPDMMRSVSRLGKILGPRGMMPSPKAGTVTDDVAKAVQEVKQGKIEFKMDKLGNIHFVIGRLSFEAKQLLENARAALQALLRTQPSSGKATLIKRLALSSTMGPSFFLKTDEFED